VVSFSLFSAVTVTHSFLFVYLLICFHHGSINELCKFSYLGGCLSLMTSFVTVSIPHSSSCGGLLANPLFSIMPPVVDAQGSLEYLYGEGSFNGCRDEC